MRAVQREPEITPAGGTTWEAGGGAQPATEGVVVPGSETRSWKRSVVRWESGLAIVLVGVILLGWGVSPQFLTSANIFNICLLNGEIALMALPLTLIIVTGEIDLSIASTLGLSSAMCGYLWEHGWPMPGIIVTCLAIGVVTGSFNGLLVTRAGLPSLAVTIGTLALYRGIALIILGPTVISNFPAFYTQIGVNSIPHTPLSFSAVIFIVLAIVFTIVLQATPLGRSIFAMGANKDAAIYAGIRVKRIKTGLFILSGVTCSLAGVLWTFRLATSEYDNAIGLELSVVAIVVLGGVSIYGGKGSLVGVLLAILVFSGLESALFLTNFPEEAEGVVTGGLLLVSVLVPNASLLSVRLRETRKRHRLSSRP